MKLISSKYWSRGFTVLDLIIVLVTLVLVIFLLPMVSFHRSRAPRNRIYCVSNLKQIGLAFRIWSGDHGQKFPMAVPTLEGGTLPFLGLDEVFHHFLAASNEMNSPKILTCPSDRSRTQTKDFTTLSNRNLSYFVGLDASELDYHMILSGDRNISTNSHLLSGILRLTINPVTKWTKDLHANCGNIGLADGSVQQVSDTTLISQINSSTNLSARVAIP